LDDQPDAPGAGAPHSTSYRPVRAALKRAVVGATLAVGLALGMFAVALIPQAVSGGVSWG
jgi:hypothetical protein